MLLWHWLHGFSPARHRHTVCSTHNVLGRNSAAAVARGVPPPQGPPSALLPRHLQAAAPAPVHLPFHRGPAIPGQAALFSRGRRERPTTRRWGAAPPVQSGCRRSRRRGAAARAPSGTQPLNPVTRCGAGCPPPTFCSPGPAWSGTEGWRCCDAERQRGALPQVRARRPLPRSCGTAPASSGQAPGGAQAGCAATGLQVFLHPRSALAPAAPRMAVYTELLQAEKRAYMSGARPAHPLARRCSRQQVACALSGGASLQLRIGAATER